MWPYIETIEHLYVLVSAHAVLRTVRRADGGAQRNSILKLALKEEDEKAWPAYI